MHHHERYAIRFFLPKQRQIHHLLQKIMGNYDSSLVQTNDLNNSKIILNCMGVLKNPIPQKPKWQEKEREIICCYRHRSYRKRINNVPKRAVGSSKFI